MATPKNPVGRRLHTTPRQFFDRTLQRIRLRKGRTKNVGAVLDADSSALFTKFDADNWNQLYEKNPKAVTDFRSHRKTLIRLAKEASQITLEEKRLLQLGAKGKITVERRNQELSELGKQYDQKKKEYDNEVLWYRSSYKLST
jgi:hypothetical protein